MASMILNIKEIKFFSNRPWALGNLSAELEAIKVIAEKFLFKS